LRATSWGRLCHPCLLLRTVQVLDVVLAVKAVVGVVVVVVVVVVVSYVRAKGEQYVGIFV
jgi:hypothetical protein